MVPKFWLDILERSAGHAHILVQDCPKIRSGKDSLLLSEKLRMLTPKQLRLIEGLLDTYIAFCNETAADD